MGDPVLATGILAFLLHEVCSLSSRIAVLPPQSLNVGVVHSLCILVDAVRSSFSFASLSAEAHLDPNSSVYDHGPNPILQEVEASRCV